MCRCQFQSAIQPGKPNQNAFIWRFNRSYRTEVLDAHLFANLEQIQALTDRWLVDGTEYRPHGADQPIDGRSSTNGGAGFRVRPASCHKRMGETASSGL
ncbi:integrase core domain-containing protein [Achromobacter piechaudii]|uniref:integrase core domain-containing protein n=1 Tax=Achromobacter piechaudii TaxID=72556 RepID=UPI0015816DAF